MHRGQPGPERRAQTSTGTKRFARHSSTTRTHESGKLMTVTHALSSIKPSAMAHLNATCSVQETRALLALADLLVRYGQTNWRNSGQLITGISSATLALDLNTEPCPKATAGRRCNDSRVRRKKEKNGVAPSPARSQQVDHMPTACQTF